MNESVNQLDLTELIKDLNRAAARAEVGVTDVLVHAGSQIQAQAVSGVPVRTGRLRDSIRMWVSQLRVVVGPDLTQADYGTYVEYGTGVRGEFPTTTYKIRPKTARALRFTVGDKTVFAQEVTHPGIRPHPYMRPAAMSWLSTLGEDVGLVGVNLIVGPNA